MPLQYCKNETLKNIGLHIEGVYPKTCDICSKVKVIKRKNTYMDYCKDKWLMKEEKELFIKHLNKNVL